MTAGSGAVNILLQDILTGASLAAPDGRLLHAYGVSDVHFEALGVALRLLPQQKKRPGASAGLYVLWASERIRRDYDGSGLSWDFINADLPGAFTGTTVAGFVRQGLDFWQRPLRFGLSGNRLFMYSLLAEGGIPIAVLESARRHTQVLRDMIDTIGSRGGIAGLGYETAFELAHQKMRYIPNILKDRDSVALFLDLAQAIFDLREALSAGLEGDRRQDWLDREMPDWKRSLPLRLTPQIIDNIIRPSLTAIHVRERPKSPPALREIHLTAQDGAVPVAIVPHSRRRGTQAIEHHHRKVRFFSTIELVNALEQEKAKGKAGQIAEGLTRLDLVVLDELGYLPFSASGGALLFHLLSKLYERTSVIITTNLT